MSHAMHERAPELIRQLFTIGLGSEAQVELREHVRDCEACERIYERFATAESAFEGRDGIGLGVSSQARVEAGLFGAPPPARGWRIPRLTAGLSVAAITVLSLALIRPQIGPSGPEAAPGGATAALPPSPGSELTPRGALTPAPKSGLALRALRLRPDAGEVTVRDLASAGTDLRSGDEIALLYVNHVGAVRAQVVLHVQGAPPRTLVPWRAVDRGVEDARLGPPVKIDEGWPRGPVRLEAHFEAEDGSMSQRSLRLPEVIP